MARKLLCSTFMLCGQPAGLTMTQMSFSIALGHIDSAQALMPHPGSLLTGLGGLTVVGVGDKPKVSRMQGKGPLCCPI